MKVILSKDVSGLGRKNEVKEVSEGHARNYLIPRHLAVPATTPVLQRIQKEEREQQEKVKKHQQAMLVLKQTLEHKSFTLSGKADKNKLFAAIHEKQIADTINKKLNLNLTPTQIIIKQPIKELGETFVDIRLTETTNAKVKIEVTKQQ